LTLSPARYEDTIDATTALQYARAWFDQYDKLPSNPWGPSPGLSAGAGRELFRFMLSRMLADDYYWTNQAIIALAKGGIAEAQDALREVRVEARRWGRKLPSEIEHYDLECTARGGDRWPRRYGGALRVDSLVRNIIIALTVAAVCDHFKLRPTHSSACTLSGCLIVGQALGISYERMKAIWRQFAGGMPTVSGWAG
jgi:hypothetical protein